MLHLHSFPVVWLAYFVTVTVCHLKGEDSGRTATDIVMGTPALSAESVYFLCLRYQSVCSFLQSVRYINERPLVPLPFRDP